MAAVAARKIDTGSTVTAANIQYPKASSNITQTGAIVEQIKLRLLRPFGPAREQTMVYVVTPEGAIDPCKRVVVFANCIGSHHGRKPLFVRTMLFSNCKLHAATDCRALPF